MHRAAWIWRAVALNCAGFPAEDFSTLCFIQQWDMDLKSEAIQRALAVIQSIRSVRSYVIR